MQLIGNVNRMGKNMTLDKLAVSLNVFVESDSTFQRRARILQAMWRKDRDISCGVRPSGDQPLGSCIPMPWAKEALENYITETIRDVVRAEVCDPVASAGKLYGKPRIFDNLLSSQPLCFNLFGELTHDLDLASAAVNSLSDGRFTEVTSIAFEYSPGRGDARYLNDRSAFDVFVHCRTADGGTGFLGIEVKYHEDLTGTADENKERYDEVADQMGCFAEDRGRLKASPLQQIWRDHLLAGITRIVDNYDDGMFVMLYPQNNPRVSSAIDNYRAQLLSDETFAAWTMEDLVDKLREHSNAPWIELFRERYLAFEKIDQRLTGTTG